MEEESGLMRQWRRGHVDATWIVTVIAVLVVAVVVTALLRARSHWRQRHATPLTNEERQALQSLHEDRVEAESGRADVMGAMDLSRRTSRLGSPFV